MSIGLPEYVAARNVAKARKMSARIGKLKHWRGSQAKNGSKWPHHGES